MPTLAERLSDAMKSSGYKVEGSDARLVPVVSKLELLSNRGRFRRLLNDLLACNNKANLHALLFEAVFAWHFEKEGRHLLYEVSQQLSGSTTVDFMHDLSQDMHVYYELRLLQQQEAITRLFEEQLHESNCFGTLLSGSDEQREVVRLQQVLLAKVQDRKGQPIKFFTANLPNYNLIVVDVSQPLLGMIDKHDCMLACYGDETVPLPCRRDVFGLFQVPGPDTPSPFQDISIRFDWLRRTIHGILFMRRPRESNPIDFDLQFYFVPNRLLLSEKPYRLILAEVADIFSPWKDTQESA